MALLEGKRIVGRSPSNWSLANLIEKIQISRIKDKIYFHMCMQESLQ